MSVTAIHKQVTLLKRQLLPKRPDDDVIVTLWPWDPNQPHGLYGCQKTNLATGKAEAPTPQEELELMRDFYEHTVPAHCKRRSSLWPTLQMFLEQSRCKCPRHFVEC